MEGSVIEMVAPAIAKNMRALAAQAADALTHQGKNAMETLCTIVAEAQSIPNPTFVEPSDEAFDKAIETVGIERAMELLLPRTVPDPCPQRVAERITARLSEIIQGTNRPSSRL